MAASGPLRPRGSPSSTFARAGVQLWEHRGLGWEEGIRGKTLKRQFWRHIESRD